MFNDPRYVEDPYQELVSLYQYSLELRETVEDTPSDKFFGEPEYLEFHKKSAYLLEVIEFRKIPLHAKLVSDLNDDLSIPKKYGITFFAISNFFKSKNVESKRAKVFMAIGDVWKFIEFRNSCIEKGIGPTNNDLQGIFQGFLTELNSIQQMLQHKEFLRSDIQVQLLLDAEDFLSQTKYNSLFNVCDGEWTPFQLAEAFSKLAKMESRRKAFQKAKLLNLASELCYEFI